MKIYKFHKREYGGPGKLWFDTNGYIGFICEHCYGPVVVKTRKHLSLVYREEVPEDHYFWARTVYSMNCPECDMPNEFDYELDPNMTEPISRLNRKGFHTEFCCEGHNNERYMFRDNYGFGICKKSNAGAYISFKNPYQARILDYIPLPEPWKRDMTVHNYTVDHNGEKVDYTLDMTKKFIIRVADHHSSLPERLSTLYRWINLLPWLENGMEITEELCLTQSVRERIAHLNDPLTEDEKCYERID